jgi:hypothetical protein
MRSYSIAIASLAIDAPDKWTDNLLSQHAIPDVLSSRRGVARRIAYPALVRLALIRQLHAGLGLGVGDAVRIASDLLDSENGGVHERGQLTLRFDRAGLERALDARLIDVLESAPAPKRGRPPGKA